MQTQPDSVEEIQDFLKINDRLGTAGQPFAEQFPSIVEAGYQAVINLAMPDSWDALPDEEQIATGLGLEYVYIPVVWEAPKPQDLEGFFTAMDRLASKKVFVHCARNMRVSAFVYLYRLIRQGEAPAEARADLNRIWQPNPTWQQFIDQSLQSADKTGPQQ